MKLRSLALAAALALAGTAVGWASWASSADTASPPATVTATPPTSVSVANSQQTRMKGCQADATAKGLKGTERQTFVNTCLKSKPSTVANSQQQKMKTCQSQATSQGLQGSDRTTFLSGCLKSN